MPLIPESSFQVNVNGTAVFNCRVVSDLTPYIFWVRIDRVNGSLHYYNETAKEYMFKYTEMDAIEVRLVTTCFDLFQSFSFLYQESF